MEVEGRGESQNPHRLFVLPTPDRFDDFVGEPGKSTSHFSYYAKWNLMKWPLIYVFVYSFKADAFEDFEYFPEERGERFLHGGLVTVLHISVSYSDTATSSRGHRVNQNGVFGVCAQWVQSSSHVLHDCIKAI